MPGPATHVSMFDGSAPGWSLVAPERYDNGLWLEEATTNYITEPSAEGSITNWSNFGSGSRSKVSSEHYDGDNAIQIVANTDFAGVQVQTAPSLGWSAGEKVALSVFTKGSGGNFQVRATLIYDDASSGNTDLVNPLVFDGSWQYPAGVATVAMGKILSRVQLVTFRKTGNVGDITFFEDMAQVERKAYATSPCHGGMGDGYAWALTPHASTSTRAASSASISPSGILDTYLGAICFKLTPTIATGVEELWGEVGVKGAGADHIRWGRDATKHPFVEWSGNDSAYTRVTLPGTAEAGAEHFYSIEWHVGDASFRLYQDGLAYEEGVIPSPQENYGAGDFVLEATAGGVVYRGLLIADERLSDAQRARLAAVKHWNMDTLIDRPYLARLRSQFELRPY